MNNVKICTAAQTGNLEEVKNLIREGADVSISNDDAIYYATIFGHSEVVKLLL